MVRTWIQNKDEEEHSETDTTSLLLKAKSPRSVNIGFYETALPVSWIEDDMSMGSNPFYIEYSDNLGTEIEPRKMSSGLSYNTAIRWDDKSSYASSHTSSDSEQDLDALFGLDTDNQHTSQSNGMLNVNVHEDSGFSSGGVCVEAKLDIMTKNNVL
eukprot:2570779-Ditylum_brightwellii.AAC.1